MNKIKPELLDIVEILVNLPEQKQFVGDKGTIVECYDKDNFEVEFINENGETTALCTLNSEQFIVVWQAETKQWLTPKPKLNLAADIEKRFAHLVNFELPEIPREPIRPLPNFETDKAN
jgi:hypothetical protein